MSLTKQRIGVDELRRKLAELTANARFKIPKGLPTQDFVLLESIRRIRRKYAAATAMAQEKAQQTQKEKDKEQCV